MIMAISAQQVKVLREKTGAGMMDCKKALAECGGEEEKAITYLREKGLAKAAKRADRAASEGVIGLYEAADGSVAALAEFKCETDFVAKSDDFKAFAAKLVDKTSASLPEGVAPMAENVLEDAGLKGEFSGLLAALGENIQPGRSAKLVAQGGIVGSYVHSNGKLGVLVEVLADNPVDAVKDFAHDAAMQVAATNPTAVYPEELPQDVLEKEKTIYKQQAIDEGKPENIAEKIVLGRINKFYKEVCLNEQPFIKDDKKTLKQLAAEVGKTAGCEVKLGRFVRLNLGETTEA
jgi:elongation factor Ts